MTAGEASECAEYLPILREGAAKLGVAIDQRQEAAFERYCCLIVAGNQRANLTGVKHPLGIMRSLLLDSLTVAAALPSSATSAKQTLVDVGSGAGIPGIPLGIAFPRWQLVLVESIGKKARFLRETVQSLDLAHAVVLEGRAEELARGRPWREAADVSTARSVASLNALIELCAPFVKPGGLLAFPKSGTIEVEIAAAASAARALCVELAAVVPVPADLDLGEGRATVLYRKVGPTPPGYPRRTGLAQSRPIGAPRTSRRTGPSGRAAQQCPAAR